MSKVIHTFFDISMGRGFPGLGLILEEKLKREMREDECAVFINAKWSAAKIIFPGRVMIYWRHDKPGGITYDELRALPKRVASQLEFKASDERLLVKGWEE